MLNELIKKDLEDFLTARKRFLAVLEKERDNLVSYAQSDNARKGYINKMNHLLGTCHAFEEKTKGLLDGIALALQVSRGNVRDITDPDKEKEMLRQKIRNLQALAMSYGIDPGLANFIKPEDLKTLTDGTEL